MNRFVMKAHELFCFQGNHRVCAPLIITELDFIHSGSPTLHNGSDLAADQTVFREVLQKGNNGMQIDFRHTPLSLQYLTSRQPGQVLAVANDPGASDGYLSSTHWNSKSMV